MFNIGPLELFVLAIVGLIVIGPDKLPQLAKDAARMLRTLRELATGARTQLRDELGPEFADVDLRNLNPRTAITRAVLGDTDLRDLDPREALKRSFLDDDEADAGANADTNAAPPKAIDAEPGPNLVKQVPPPAPKPLGRGESAPYDDDAT